MASLDLVLNQVIVYFLRERNYRLNTSALNRTAEIGIIRKLYRDGLLNDAAFKAASGVLRPVSIWFSWVRRMLLFFGSALVLAGIIFFFAYNWAAMGKFLKFGLLEAGILVCIVASHLRGRTQLSGKVLLLSSSVLVGVLLAVYGQIYQTGADAYGLFLSWALLIFGWVIISEFAALWVIWLILLNTGAILYWQQVGDHVRSSSMPDGPRSIFLQAVGRSAQETNRTDLEWKNL